MVIKFLGIIITVASSWIYGYYASEYIKKREEELLSFKKAFVMLGAELKYGGNLWEVFERVEKRCDGAARRVFLAFSSALYEKDERGAEFVWKKCLEGNTKNSFLSKDDIESLCSFGKGLGFSDGSFQEENINIAVSFIDTKMKELRERYLKESKLYRSLSVMTGLLAAVVVL